MLNPTRRLQIARAPMAHAEPWLALVGEDRW